MDELEEEVEEGQDDVPATTTTEAPKKSLVRGGVRPFRSNEELLAALKRRREQQVRVGAATCLTILRTPRITLATCCKDVNIPKAVRTSLIELDAKQTFLIRTIQKPKMLYIVHFSN